MWPKPHQERQYKDATLGHLLSMRVHVSVAEILEHETIGRTIERLFSAVTRMMSHGFLSVKLVSVVCHVTMNGIPSKSEDVSGPPHQPELMHLAGAVRHMKWSHENMKTLPRVSLAPHMA